MKKKIVLLAGIFSFMCIGLHSCWIERFFRLHYCFGSCVEAYLLFIIIAILLFRKNK